jgi:hypothetical protein
VAGATDIRRGCDGLAALVQTHLSANPCFGELFLFTRLCVTREAKRSFDISAVVSPHGAVIVLTECPRETASYFLTQ